MPPMADFQLKDKASTDASRRRFDPWLVGAAVFFVAAAAFSAAPALKAGPTTLAGLLLLLGVAGVAILGLVAIKGSSASGSDADQAEGFIDALSEPSALAAADGRLLAANLAWREVMGEQRRLPKGVAGSSLFAALVQARTSSVPMVLAAVSQRRASRFLPAGSSPSRATWAARMASATSSRTNRIRYISEAISTSGPGRPRRRAQPSRSAIGVVVASSKTDKVPAAERPSTLTALPTDCSLIDAGPNRHQTSELAAPT